MWCSRWWCDPVWSVPATRRGKVRVTKGVSHRWFQPHLDILETVGLLRHQVPCNHPRPSSGKLSKCFPIHNSKWQWPRVELHQSMQLSQCHSNAIASSDLELQDPCRLDKRVRSKTNAETWWLWMIWHFEHFESNNFQSLLSFDIKGTTTGIRAKTNPAKTRRSHDMLSSGIMSVSEALLITALNLHTERSWQGSLMSSCPAMTMPPIRETMMPRRATKAALVAWPSPKLFAMRMPTLSPIAMANRNDKIKIFITSKSWVSAQNCEFFK